MAINLLDAYLGATRMISLRMPAVDAAGQTTRQERQLEVNIPRAFAKASTFGCQGRVRRGRVAPHPSICTRRCRETLHNSLSIGRI